MLAGLWNEGVNGLFQLWRDAVQAAMGREHHSEQGSNLLEGNKSSAGGLALTVYLK